MRWAVFSTLCVILAFSACGPTSCLDDGDSLPRIESVDPAASDIGRSRPVGRAASDDPSAASSSIAGEVTRFVVLGDGGTGGAAQYQVARAVADVCRAHGCDFALYLGDNIYERGPDAVDDTQFRDKFELPYAALDFPFYVVLGNHDYVGDLFSGTAFDANKGDLEVAYSARSRKWTMPNHYYAIEHGPVALFAIDTTAILYGEVRDALEQGAWLEAAIAQSRAPWKIVFGHHPYISNGSHGNAGHFDGRTENDLPSQNGEPLKRFVEQNICHRAQVYFAGHDHDREWLDPVCGTSFIVSGAAAKLRALASRDAQPTRFVDDAHFGFLWVEADAEGLRGVFFDDSGAVSYRDAVEL